MVRRALHFFFPAVLLSFLVCGQAVLGQELQKDLYQLTSLRKGPKTPFAEVEELGKELLKKYHDPKDQGLIYYQLAHIYAQSGMVKPDRVVYYAKMAMEYPLDLSPKLRLYVYWGDALQIGDPKGSFAEKRKSAVKPYLEGLKEVEKLKLPEKAPDLPGVSRYDRHGTPEEVAKARKEHEEAVAARKRVELERELIMHRDVLTAQIVGLYSREPYAKAELEREASRILEDPETVTKVVSRVKEKVVVAESQPAKPAPGEEPSGRTQLFLVIGSAALLVLVTAALLFRRRLGGRLAK